MIAKRDYKPNMSQAMQAVGPNWIEEQNWLEEMTDCLIDGPKNPLSPLF